MDEYSGTIFLGALLGLTFTATDRACSFEQGFLFVFLVLSSKLMYFNLTLFLNVVCSLFMPSYYFLTVLKVPGLVSITRLYPEIVFSSTAYIQLLVLSDLGYMNKMAVYYAWLSVMVSSYVQVNS